MSRPWGEDPDYDAMAEKSSPWSTWDYAIAFIIAVLGSAALTALVDSVFY